MLDLPPKTLYNKRIPKNKFYAKLQAGSNLKDKFVRQIDQITWKHKLSPQTVNLASTAEVQEIQVFEVHLKQKELSREVLESMDRAIPYPVLFVLIHGEEARLAIAYKKRSRQHENRFVVDSYYFSPWQHQDKLSLQLLKGLDLKAVYEHIIKSLISGDSKDADTGTGNNTGSKDATCTSGTPSPGPTLEETIAAQKAKEKLERDIDGLQAKIAKERQFNRKVKYNLELQEKMRELEKL